MPTRELSIAATLALCASIACAPRDLPGVVDPDAGAAQDGGAAGVDDDGGSSTIGDIDAGFVAVDGGLVAVDGGFTIVDGGLVAVDGGFTSADGGFAAADAGFADAGNAQPEIGPADIVTDATYDRLIIEVDYITGHAPDAEALAIMADEIQALVARGSIEKSGGFDVVLDDALPAHAQANHAYTFDEQRALSIAHRDLQPAPGEAFVHMLYLDGHSDRDDDQGRILGYAYSGSWIAMFGDSIRTSCDDSAAGTLLTASLAEDACDVTEASVLLHEMGHLFGLVNNGTALTSAHEDAVHTKHDVDDACLMYWAVDTSSAVDVVVNRFLVGDTGVAPFDAACLADLDAAAAAD